MIDVFPTRPGPGYRLDKLEVYNWGTFDSTRGNVFTARTNGQMALLIGQNGSGKSTLVDAILTLLVRPRVRNYNVAAGAKKKERDERTYIKGAYDRRSRKDNNEASTQYLRPGNKHYSCLLACFRNADSGKAFTCALVLYVNSDGKSEKVYCFSNDERSIATDFSGLTSMDKLPTQLGKRGLKATTTYTEYYGWLRKVTGMRPKAMDMLNQTVAVKDIDSLNTFIRDHMLEARPWADRVESLLDHFTQLSMAHRSLVRVRRQQELLQPIAAAGDNYRQLAADLSAAEQLMEAADSYFRQKTVDLFGPQLKSHAKDLTAVQRQRKALTRQIADTSEEQRRLQNEIENGGNERAGRLPLLIQTERNKSDAKIEAGHRMNERLAVLELGPVRTRRQFDAAWKKLNTIGREHAAKLRSIDKQRDQRVVDRNELLLSLQTLREELQSLKECRNNLPESLHLLRRQVCKALRIPESELPFAAELLAVHPDFDEWSASIEKALSGFARSLLVPDEHYAAVNKYLEKTRLIDRNKQGQRIVYVNAMPLSAKPANEPVLHPHSMLRKLQIRKRHPLASWVRQQLISRFDIRCCETLSKFQKATGAAMTRQRHIRFANGRLEKDDREHTTSPRHFILGWKNDSKRRLLRERIEKLSDGLQQVEERIAVLDQERETIQQQQAAIVELKGFSQFETIDATPHVKHATALLKEKSGLESGDDVVTQLKQRLVETQSRLAELNQQRDNEVGNERLLQAKIDSDQQTLDAAGAILAKRKADKELAKHRANFAELDQCFEKRPLTAETLRDREPVFLRQQQAKLDRLRRRVEPVQVKLTTAMNRFLRDFADERADLEARADYLDGFLGLLQRIDSEDLPRHERRFRERLNEKVTQEVGFLNGALQTEATEIRAGISTLNKSLCQLEYRPGTFMRLEPRPVKDREIAEFQKALADCLADKFDGKADADEARFLKIEKLIKRLRDEERWRRKVTDVRRWFDFAALEIDSATNKERSCYTDTAGQSGGEKAKLAFTILVAAIAYQYDIDADATTSDRFHFVVVDEMFSKVDDKYSQYALELFRRFGLQLLIVAPLDAKARVTERYVGCYLQVVKDERTSQSELFSMTAREFDNSIVTDRSGTKPGKIR